LTAARVPVDCAAKGAASPLPAASLLLSCRHNIYSCQL